MCIKITHAQPQVRCIAMACIAQMRRHGAYAYITHIGQRFVDSQISSIAFRRAGNICHSLCQRYSAFRHADKVDCLHCRNSHLQCVRISIAHVLRRTNDNAAGNKLRVLPCIYHFCQIIQSRVRVRAAHAFDKRRYGVIMVVATLIIIQSPSLNTVLSRLQGYVNFSRFVRICS